MKRRALIIYCDDTESGSLVGPIMDAKNIKTHLMSLAGGEWRRDEIRFLRNPTTLQVKHSVSFFMKNADYTFTVFSGHGYLNLDDGNKQYLELRNRDLALRSLITNAPRQTIIVDACRGYFSRHRESLVEEYAAFLGDIEHLERVSTRRIFDAAVKKAERGLTVLYSASANETSLDSPSGGAFLFSLLTYAQHWGTTRSRFSYLPMNTALKKATEVMDYKFDTIQRPMMNREKRLYHFPLAVKIPSRPLQYLN